jgi:RNA polymerase sigma-70 factor (ECF subfamily)
MSTLSALLESYKPRLLAMLRRRLDPALSAQIDPEEILQEAFLTAWRKWDASPELADQSPYEKAGMTAYAWLYRICRDCLIEAWRRETRACRDPRDRMPFPEHSSVQLAVGLINPGTTPSSAFARQELQKRMQQLLELLSQDDREILWLRHYDELSYKEVAMVLGIKPATANVRYFRALDRLRQLWLKLADGQ